MGRRKTSEELLAEEIAYASYVARGIDNREAYCRARGVEDWTDKDWQIERRWREKPAVQAIVAAAHDARVSQCLPSHPGLTWEEVAGIVASIARIEHEGDPVKARAVIDALRFWRSAFGSALPAVKPEAVAEIELRFEDTTGL